MARTISDRGLALVKESEGCRLTAYRDSGGVPTIGYGSTLGVHMGDTVTPAEAETLLRRDLAIAEAAVNTLVTVPLEQHQFDALMDFVFNLGSGALSTSTLLRKLNAGDYASVPDELRKWCKCHVGGELVTLDGLVKRREREALMWSEAPLPAPRPPVKPGLLALVLSLISRIFGGRNG